jgi:hypothetical protein
LELSFLIGKPHKIKFKFKELIKVPMN